jgi:ankyrin repeat protein
MYNYKKNLILAFVATSSVISIHAKQLLVGEPQQIKIVNGAEQSLQVTHDIPEYAQASIELTRLPEPQKMLYDAIVSNSAKDILQAVKVGANVNMDIDGKLPILIAMSLKKMNSVEVLKKCGAIVPDLKNMMYRAILNDSPEEIKYAVKAGADLTEEIRDKKTALVWAILLGRSNVVGALLECGAKANTTYAGKSLVHDVNTSSDAHMHGYYCGIPLLHCALLLSDIKSAILLLKTAPVNRDTRGLHNAIKAGRHGGQGKNIFDYVITEIDPTGIKDLILEFVQILIDHGWDINTNFYDERTGHSHYGQDNHRPHSAWISALDSLYFSTEVFELLMKNGANPNQVIYGGHLCTGNPLMWAIYHNNIKAVKYLLDVGADVNKQVTYASHPRNATQGTLLSYTRTLKGVDNHEIIALLMKYGAR